MSEDKAMIDEEDATALLIFSTALTYWVIRNRGKLTLRSQLRRTFLLLVALQIAPKLLIKVVSSLIGIINSLAGEGSQLYQAAGDGDADRVSSLLVSSLLQEAAGRDDGQRQLAEVANAGRQLLFGLLMYASPLSISVKSTSGSSLDATVALLEAKADPNRGASHGPFGFISAASPIFTAAKSEDVPPTVVEALLKAGASPDAGTTIGPRGIIYNLPPVVFAVRSRAEVQTTKLRLLLEAGADPNQRSTLGVHGTSSSLTALHMAVGSNNTEAVSLLLRHGADPNALSKAGPAGCIYRETALVMAARSDQQEIVKLLLEAGADAQLGYQNGPMGVVAKMSALSIACQKNFARVVKLLLVEGKADPDRGVEIGPFHGLLYKIPPLVAASNGNYTKIIKMLLVAGADRNKCAKYPVCKEQMMHVKDARKAKTKAAVSSEGSTSSSSSSESAGISPEL